MEMCGFGGDFLTLQSFHMSFLDVMETTAQEILSGIVSAGRGATVVW